MADGIYYNQEVTAEMINEIAIDLGHTSFNGFGTEKFGAAELNNITAELVTEGILQSGGKCEPILSDGYINIQSGIIVFADGAKKAITEAVSFESHGSGVVYALNDTAAGTASLVYADTYPTGGDFVKICTINSEGIVDDRAFSYAKALDNAVSYFENKYYEGEFSASVSHSSPKLVGTISQGVEFNYVMVQFGTDDLKCKAISDGDSIKIIRYGGSVYAQIEREGTVYTVTLGSGGSGGTTVTAKIILA